MSFKKGTKIDKDFILSHIKEEDIFERYFRPVLYDSNVTNDARNDSNAGCRFYTDKQTGRIRFKDFGHGYNWDCFDAASKHESLSRLSFPELLKVIAEDFHLIEINGKQKSIRPNLISLSNEREEKIKEANKVFKKRIVLINKRRKYSWKDRKYWKQFAINDATLYKFYVYTFDKAYLIKTYKDGTTEKVPLYSTSSELKFAYYLGVGEWKLYYPERPKSRTRFIQLRGDIIQGWSLLPDKGENLLFTKSYKDVMSFDVLGSIPAVATQSENIIIPKNIIKEAKGRFKNLYILYDNDMAGMRAMVRNLVAYPFLKPLLFPKGDEKDLSDNIKKHGLLKIQESILPLIN